METYRLKKKDYLPFYISAPCFIGDLSWKRPKVAELDLAPYIDLDWGKPVKTHLDLHTIQAFADQVTLILRPLSSIPEEEWRDIEQKSSVLPDAWGYNGIMDNFLKDTPDLRFGWPIINETLIELRKRGIDVDGLIDAGLAIDGTKLQLFKP